MKRLCFITLILIALLLSSCAPVLREEVMRAASFDFPVYDMRSNPAAYKGKLFALGGIIVQTKFTEEGSVIEAVYVPVDSRGNLKDIGALNERYLAIFSRDKGLLDPLIYRKNREITLAGEFIDIRRARIDEMLYAYPVFEIKEIYLWRETVYYPYYPYWYYPYYPYWYEPWPWWRPWGPWWRYHSPYWW